MGQLRQMIQRVNAAGPASSWFKQKPAAVPVQPVQPEVPAIDPVKQRAGSGISI